MRTLLVVGLLIALTLCLPMAAQGADVGCKAYGISPIVFEIAEGYGTRYAVVGVANDSDVDSIIRVEFSRDAILVNPAPESWFVRFSDPVLVPPYLDTVLNMTIEVPERISSGEYNAILKVYVGEKCVKDVEVVIRLGSNKAVHNQTWAFAGIGLIGVAIGSRIIIQPILNRRAKKRESSEA